MLEVAVRPRARLNVLSLYGMLGLVMAAVIHFGTYVGSAVSPMNRIFWALHVGIFPLFIVFALRVGAWQEKRRGAFGLMQRHLRWRALLPYFPRWVPALVVLLFIYVLANFFFSILHMPTKGSRSPFTDSHMVYMARAFSGHWLLFYTLPTLFFAFVPWSAKPVAEATDAVV